MLGTSRLICFLATTNGAKATEFYQGILGLSLVDDNPDALVFVANGTMLRIQKVREFDPAAFTVLGWQVENLRATIKQLSAAGIRFERYDHLPQDDMGCWISPAGATVAWFQDPDGNTLSLTEFRSV